MFLIKKVSSEDSKLLQNINAFTNTNTKIEIKLFIYLMSK
jgi:hypothetical protein